MPNKFYLVVVDVDSGYIGNATMPWFPHNRPLPATMQFAIADAGIMHNIPVRMVCSIHELGSTVSFIIWFSADVPHLDPLFALSERGPRVVRDLNYWLKDVHRGCTPR